MSTPAGWETTGELVRFRANPHSIRGSIAPLVDAVRRRRQHRPRQPAPPRALAARVRLARHLDRWLDRRAQRADGRRAHRGDARRRGGDRRSRAVPARHRLGEARRDVGPHRRGARSRRRCRARHHTLLRAPHPGRPLRMVRHDRARVSRPADRALQCADPHRRRRGARDAGAPAPRVRQRRRHQGDDEGLRALLARAPPVRARHAGMVGDRAALPAAAGDRRASASSAPSPTSRRAPSRACTSSGLPATTRRPSRSTTACIRSST